MSRVVIIGGGASGMMAAAAAAENGNHVVILEKNEKTGKKIYITGKGRCNLTNASDNANLMANVVSNPRFMYSAFSHFGSEDVMDFMEKEGCPVKTERGNRVFPVSDHASDVTAALMRRIRRLGVNVRLTTEAAGITVSEGRVTGVTLKNGGKIETDAAVIATGGLSYRSTGSSGDGYRFAREAGHTVSRCVPSLTSFKASESWCGRLEGLALKNVGLSLICGGRKVYDAVGEMLFTHDGISGPLVLTASAYYAKAASAKEMECCRISIDLKPGLTEEQLDRRIQRDWTDMQNRDVINSLDKLIPSSLIPVIIELSGIAGGKKVNSVTHEERVGLVKLIKDLGIDIAGTGGFEEAVITQGGVNVKEINPATMESKLVHGLYFAGEVIDVDALTGGYNLQIAWSTGYTAGSSIY